MLAPADGGSAGVVYTKTWMVELILDLSGYTADKPLFELRIVEPSAGDGAFLVGIVRRLSDSCKRHNVALECAVEALRAYEIDDAAAANAARSVETELEHLGCTRKAAQKLSRAWISKDDFLDASLQFPSADFVVGNPPYIRLEEIPETKAQSYRSTYRTMRGRADLYVAFFEAALAQLKPNGVCAYICADRWLLNEYGGALREFITSGFAVRTIVDAHDVDAFEANVSAYPAITVIQASAQGPVTVGKLLPGAEQVATRDLVHCIKAAHPLPSLRVATLESWFEGDSPWPCSSPDSLRLLRQLEAAYPPLEVANDTYVGIGVATGADDVFVTDHKPAVEESRALPLAMAFDLKAGKVQWSGHYLVNPWDEDGLVSLGDFPRLDAYLRPSFSRLAARHTAKGRPAVWHKTIDRVNMNLLNKAKLLIPDIKDRLSPSFDTGGFYPHHNVYWITSSSWDLRVLGGILISSVAEFFIRSYGVKMRGGYFRFQAQYLRRIRVPPAKSIPPHLARKLALAFETQDTQLASQTALQLYGITSVPVAA